MVFGLGPMGCIPLQRALSLDGNCQNKASNLAKKFNKAATTMLLDLEAKLPNASYRFGEAYDLVNNIITNPKKYGTNKTLLKSNEAFINEISFRKIIDHSFSTQI